MSTARLSAFVGYLLHTDHTLSEETLRRAHRLLIGDGMCSMVMGTLLGAPFLTAFALGIGASHYDVGLIAAIGFFCQPIQLLGLYLLRIFPKRRTITFLGALASRLLWIFIMLIPILFVDRGKTFFLHWLFLSTLIGAIPAPSWNSLVRDIVPAGRLGHIFAQRMLWGTLVSVPLTLAGGLFIDWWKTAHPGEALYAYTLLFGVAVGFGLAGTVTLARLPEPAMRPDESPHVPLVELLQWPLKDVNFRRLLWFIASWNFVLNMVTPFFVMYMLKRIGLSMGMVTVLTVLSQLTNLLFLKVWGRLADRYSNKSVLALSGPLVLIGILAWDFTTLPERYVLTIPLLVGIHILSGMSLAGVTLAVNNISLKLSPPGLAHIYMTVVGLVGAFTGAIAPLVGGTLADLFASRELSLSIAWDEPGRHVSVYALDVRALDFLFVIAFLVGLFALSRLRKVQEEGEVHEREVLDDLVDQVVLPFRAISSVEELRRLTYLPLHALRRARKVLSDDSRAPS